MAEINSHVTAGNYGLGLVLTSLLADITTLKTALNVLGVKLNSDGGVSDADYSTGVAVTTTGGTT